MPDFWAHNIVGTVVLKENLQLRKEFWKDINKHSNLFRFGCQGPDLFFYLNSRNVFLKGGYSNFAGVLHNEKIKEYFKYILKKSKSSSTENKAYTAGLICHYLTDKVCHPLINDLSSDKLNHKSLELMWDIHLTSAYLDKEFKDLAPEDYIDCNEKERDAMSKLISDLSISVYDKTIAYELAYRSIEDFIFGEKLVMKGSLSKLPCKSLIAKITGIDVGDYAYPKGVSYEILTRKSIDRLDYLFTHSIEDCIIGLKWYDMYLKDDISIDKFIDKFIDKDYNGGLL